MLVLNEGIIDAENSSLFRSLLGWIYEGGKVICIGMFPSDIPAKINEFFSRAGLNWAIQEEHESNVYINAEHLSQRARNSLPPYYFTKAFFLKNVDREHAWYCPPDSPFDSPVFGPRPSNPNVFSAAMAPCLYGKVGFVGNTREEVGSTAVILGMIGIWYENLTFGQRAPLR